MSVALSDAPFELYANSALSPSQRKGLVRDLHFLGSLEGGSPNEAELKKLLGVKSSSGEALLAWTSQRLRYVSGSLSSDEINASMRFFSVLSPLQHIEYNESGGGVNKSAELSSIAVAANLGTGLYMRAKEQGIRARFDFAQDLSIDIHSPRIGLVLLFNQYFSNYMTEMDLPRAAQFYRISTLLHEARHGDGRGDSLGFRHALCPDSKPEYAGLAACDLAPNGAYSIEAALFQKFLSLCAECSAAERAVMRGIRADMLYRLLPESETQGYWDAQPESFSGQL